MFAQFFFFGHILLDFLAHFKLSVIAMRQEGGAVSSGECNACKCFAFFFSTFEKLKIELRFVFLDAQTPKCRRGSWKEGVVLGLFGGCS